MSCKILGGAAAAKPIVWPSADGGRPAPARAPEPAAARAPLESELIAEMERRVGQAREAAFREGESAGAARASARLDPVVAGLSRAIEQLAALRGRVRHEAEQDVVVLSLAIARRVLHRELSIDPDALLGVVKAALDKLDLRELHRVRLNPEDARAVEGRIAAGGNVEIAADPALPRGSALFETSRGVLDASVDTQLEEIRRGLADAVGRR